MLKANEDFTTSSSRRRFLAFAGAASAVTASALAVAAMPQTCALADDSELLKLEELIFEQYEGACSFDDEILRLANIWTEESHRLYDEALAREKQTGKYLSARERWALVTDTPACIEHNRLCNLQEPYTRKMEALIDQMFAMPAHTAEGRRAKATVLLVCIMGSEWTQVDAETDYAEMQARRLLIEFIGGKPGEMLRGQFA